MPGPDARRLHRPRQPDERARRTTATPRLARARRRRADAAGDPRRVGPLVHQRHGGHRDGARRARSTTSRLPRRALRRPVPRAGRSRARRRDRRIVKPTWVGLDADSWGIDHGTWSVLVHASPRPTPGLQLSINATKPSTITSSSAPRSRRCASGCARSSAAATSCTTCGASTGPTRRGVRLGRRFDDAVATVMTERPGGCPPAEPPRLRAGPPTPDHFIPLLYVAGLAAAAGEHAHVLVDGYAMGRSRWVSTPARRRRAGAGGRRRRAGAPRTSRRTRRTSL